jgi:MFS family permease
MSQAESANPSSNASGKRLDFSHAWRALRSHNFRLYFGGQGLSLCGTWMTRVAMSWLVYRLTKSALLLGVVGFAGQIPGLFLAPLAGVIVDRSDRRTVMVVTQILAMLQSLALAVLTLTHVINIYEVLALALLQGCTTAFDTPARQSLMVRLVEDRNDLSNAIAINAAMTDSARLIGPSIAGLIIAATNEGWCFLIDGVSFIAVIASLLAMRLKPAETAPAKIGMTEQLREGWGYVAGSLPIRSILLLFAVVSLMGWPFMALLPIFAAQTLHGGPHTLGFLTGAVGVGALIAALGLVLRRSVLGLEIRLPQAALFFGFGLIFFAAVDGLGRLRHGEGAGFKQHHSADAHRRAHARARDELLHAGSDGLGADWQPDGRRAGRSHWRVAHGDDYRSGLHRRRRLVLAPVSLDARGDAAHLSRARAYSTRRDAGVLKTAQRLNRFLEERHKKSICLQLARRQAQRAFGREARA